MFLGTNGETIAESTEYSSISFSKKGKRYKNTRYCEFEIKHENKDIDMSIINSGIVEVHDIPNEWSTLINNIRQLLEIKAGER